MKDNLWHVTYDYIFESSTGVSQYSIPHDGMEGYVVTETPDLGCVEKELLTSIPHLCRLQRVRKATWLGRLLNRDVKVQRYPTISEEIEPFCDKRNE